MSNSERKSEKTDEDNKCRNRLFQNGLLFYKEHFLLIIFLISFMLSWVIFSEFWSDVIDLLVVNTIASKFDPEKWFWCWSYGIILFAFVMFYSAVVWIERKSSKTRLLVSLFIATIFTVCLYSNDWTFKGYYAYFLYLPIVFEIVLCLKCYTNKVRSKYAKDSDLGLKFDKPLTGKQGEKRESGNIDLYNRAEYIKSAANELKNTFDSEIAFAVGISGKWGSGKTSFTNELKELLDPKINSGIDIILEFKPWFCKTPNDIIDDFFKEYRSRISKYAPGLSSSIENYSNSLKNIEVTIPFFKMPIKYLRDEKSGLNQYAEITAILSQLKLKTLIIIDDTDRLNKDEIMEVLRLVRNTANFPYTQFIVTYDKEYITKTIGIGDDEKSEEYLRKIFNLEINLPSYEGQILCDELRRALLEVLLKLGLSLVDSHLEVITHNYIDSPTYQRQITLPLPETTNQQLNNIVHSFRDTDTDNIGFLIPKILHSTRDIIRFSNSFKLNLFAIKESKQIDEIDIVEFIGLELIRYRYTNLYYELRDNPLSLLYINNDTKTYQIDNPQKTDPKTTSNKVSSKLSEIIRGGDCELAEFLLKNLFSAKETKNRQPISNISNYLTYFAYRIDNKNMSKAEFNAMVIEREKYPLDSIEQLFKDKNKRQLQERLTDALIDSFRTETKATDWSDNYSQLYKFTMSIYEIIEDAELSNEIVRAVIEQYNPLRNFQINIRSIDSAQYKAVLEFWCYFSNIISEKNNFEILYSLLGGSEFTADIQAILSKTKKPFALSKSIKAFVSRMDEFENKGNYSHIKVVDLIQIQLEQLKNYIESKHNINEEALELFDYAITSTYFIKNEVLKTKISEQMKMYVELYVESYLKDIVKKNSIDEIGIGNNWVNIFGIEEFDLFVYDSKKSDFEGIDKIRNVWKIYKNNDYKPFRPVENLSDNDFSLTVKKLESLSMLEARVSRTESKLSSSKMKTSIIPNEIKQEINRINNEFDSIDLYIIKRGNLAKRIDNLAR